MVTNPITYERLHELLVRLGFSRQRVNGKWLRYEHTASDSVIVLIEKKPSELVRATDALSACKHVLEKGLISAEELDALLSRRPMATSGRKA